jgi:integrase/recombinase XerD
MRDQLPDVMPAWILAMRSEGQSPATIRRRTGTVRRIGCQLHIDPRTLDVDAINAWLSRYPAAATRAAYFSDVAAYFAWLQLTGRLDVSPVAMMRRPRQPKRRPRPVTTGELAAALATATGDVHDWIVLGAYGGLRVSEAAAIRGEHVRGGGLRVLGKASCGRGPSDKVIPLHPEIAEIAARMPSRGWWFPGQREGAHIGAHTIGDHVPAHFASVGCTMTFHQLRHWCGTELLRSGADLRQVQEFLRHDSIASTALYTQVSQDELAAAVRLLPSLDGAPAPRRFVA